MDVDRPLVAVTIGDPAGIGPEVVLGALNTVPEIYDVCRPLVIGDLPVLQRAAQTLAIDPHINRVSRPGDGYFRAGAIDLLDMQTPGSGGIAVGQVQPAAGRAA